MEMLNAETNAVEELVNQIQGEQIRSLSEVHLALVGGGIGDVVFV